MDTEQAANRYVVDEAERGRIEKEEREKLGRSKLES
jgi:hypothetical protein